MSGRDLLYKPQVPVVMPDEETARAKRTDKAKSRDLGSVGEAPVKPSEPAGKPKAYQNAYFNKDISGVRQVNLNTSRAGALRGSEGVTDLKKVVLPPTVLEGNPEPGKLKGALDLMGLDSNFAESLESLLNRQGAWAKGKGVTVEMIEQRLKQLEEMVQARRVALARMAKGKGNRSAASVTIETARRAAGKALEGLADVGAAGTTLIRATASQAEGLHRRIAKMFGVKGAK